MRNIARSALGVIMTLSINQSLASPPPTLCPYHLDNAELTLEYARKNSELVRGLMYREQLPKDQGMLFVLPGAIRASFWMKNTQIPLSIAYLNQDMQVIEMYDLQPHDLTAVKSKARNIKYALEVNQGWFKTHQIKVGSALKLGKKSQNTACQIM